MNPLDVQADSNSKALVDFLQGRRGGDDGVRRADLLLDRGSLTPGLRTMGDARVLLHMDGPDQWSVEIQQGRVGLFGAQSRTAIYGEPDLLEAIILLFLVASPVIRRVFRLRGVKSSLGTTETMTRTYGSEAIPRC